MPCRGHHLSAMEFLLDKLKATKNNADFFDSMRRG
jgi:transcription termination factor Rho